MQILKDKGNLGSSESGFYNSFGLTSSVYIVSVYIIIEGTGICVFGTQIPNLMDNKAAD